MEDFRVGNIGGLVLILWGRMGVGLRRKSYLGCLMGNIE